MNDNTKKMLSNDKGFTLIEIVTSLVVLSIISVIAGMGIISIVNGYVFTKKNAETALKGQVAIARIVRELSTTDSITAGDGTSITFQSQSQNPAQQKILYWNSGDKTLSIGPPAGNLDILADNVNSFSLAYNRFYNDTTPSTIYSSSSTAIIQVTIGLKGADDVVSTFINRVFLSKLMTGI